MNFKTYLKEAFPAKVVLLTSPSFSVIEVFKIFDKTAQNALFCL